MTKRRLVWLVAVLVAALLLPVTPVLADEEPPDGVFIWDDDYTVKAGESVEGDLVVLNGHATVEAGGQVEGSIVVWNGDADVDGVVEGDLVISGGDITLGDNARITGSVICTWNCNLAQESGTRIEGSIIDGPALPALRIDGWQMPPTTIPHPLEAWATGSEMVVRTVLRFAQSLILVLLVAAIAGLVTLMLPQQTARVGQTVAETPWPSLGYGLLTTVAALALIVILTITICLSPIAILGALALIAGGLFGWLCIGALIGERLLRALKVQDTAPVWAAGLGTLVITLVTAGLSAFPCIGVLGWLLIFLVGALGLGAAVLTRFGTRPYPPAVCPDESTRVVPPEAPTPPEPVEEQTKAD